jgi:hypothetical protein
MPEIEIYLQAAAAAANVMREIETATAAARAEKSLNPIWGLMKVANVIWIVVE